MSITNSNPGWDPNSLRLDPNNMAGLKCDTGRGRRVSPIIGRFIAGPVDVAWVLQAAQLGVTALLVGLALWHLKGLRRADSFIVSNLMMQEWGIRPDAKSRALRKLEKAGLIIVGRRGKRSPTITLLVGNTVETGVLQ
jgi:hypothetical protein